jgi:hypothetical protein
MAIEIVTGGPSKEALFDALRLHRERRAVDIRVKAPWGNEVKRFAITLVSLMSKTRMEDEWWYVEGYGFALEEQRDNPMFTMPFRLVFSTRYRRGVLVYIDARGLKRKSLPDDTPPFPKGRIMANIDPSFR